MALGRWEPHPLVSYVAGDAVAAGFIATRHLIELGHRRIAFLSSVLDPQTCGDRLDGYREALAQASILFDPSLVAPAPFRPGGGTEAAELLLSRDPRPTAMVAISNTVAHEAMRALAEHGLRVPEDVAIVAFDDTWLSVMTSPPLTSVRQPLFEMGQQAVEMLARIIANGHTGGEPQPPQRITCPVSLVVRASTAGSAAIYASMT